MNRLGENSQIFSEVMTVTSAAGATSLGYSMEDCDKITFVCGLGTIAASTAGAPVMTARQSADAGLSTSTTIGGATAAVGISTANQLTNVRSALITISSASTDGNTLVLNGYTLTQSTVGSATIATAMTFGATAGTTDAAGLASISNSLSSVINNSTLSYFMTASTPSTATVRLTAKDTASTGITLVSTGVHTVTLEKAHSIVEILAQDLNSTSKYVGVALSTAMTSAAVSVTVIKQGLRNSPPYQSAQAHKKST